MEEPKFPIVITRVLGGFLGKDVRDGARRDAKVVQQAMREQNLTREMVVLSMTPEHNVQVYELDPEHTREWTPEMKVAACRDNVWGATVVGSTVRLSLD